MRSPIINVVVEDATGAQPIGRPLTVERIEGQGEDSLVVVLDANKLGCLPATDSNDVARKLGEAIQHAAVKTGGIIDGVELTGPQLTMALSDMTEEFLRMRSQLDLIAAEDPHLMERTSASCK